MSRYNNEELSEISAAIYADGHHELSSELYWWNSIGSFVQARMPEIVAVMNCPLRKVPLQINSYQMGVATIARWRLKIGK
jgi:hypothetical protein